MSYFNKKNSKPKLNVDKATKLRDVFISNKWKIDIKDKNNKFGKYIRLLESLNNEEEQDLILDLTKRFIHVRDEEYLDHLVTALNKLHLFLPEIKTFNVFPALPKKDLYGLPKSAHSIFYRFKGDQIDEKLNFSDVNFHPVNDIDRFNSNILNSKQKILLVDDFIGSGDTALEATHIISSSNRNNIIFLCIVIHELGLERLENEGYKVFYAIKINKGISNYYSGFQKENNTQLMKRIEQKIPKLQEEYKFGYKQCEALLCMSRMPNNTFPIYWLKSKVSPYKR